MLDSGLVSRGSQHYRSQSCDGSRTILESPPQKEKWVLTTESFDGMLSWLNRDRDLAGEKYEEIRSRLINRFRKLGCSEPEELANATFDRVARKLPEIVAGYNGDREPYFFSVAHNIYREHLRTPVITSLASPDLPQPDLPGPEEIFQRELMDSCLLHCVEKLDPTHREMIMDYYYGERHDKIAARKKLAERMGIKVSNLRLRAQRVRASLKQCILDCMKRQARERGA